MLGVLDSRRFGVNFRGVIPQKPPPDLSDLKVSHFLGFFGWHRRKIAFVIIDIEGLIPLGLTLLLGIRQPADMPRWS